MILTEEQQMIRDAARAFATEQLAPNAETWASQGKVPVDVLQAMGELGFMGMCVPEEWDAADTRWLRLSQ